MQINWKVRIKNPYFIAQVLVAIFLPILTHLGLNWEDLTTWAALWHILVEAVKNPVIVVAVVVSVFNAITDPTTKGMGDSDRAMTYEDPN